MTRPRIYPSMAILEWRLILTMNGASQIDAILFLVFLARLKVLSGRRSTLEVSFSYSFLKFQHFLKSVVLYFEYILINWCLRLHMYCFWGRLYFFGVKLEKRLYISMMMPLFRWFILVVHNKAPIDLLRRDLALLIISSWCSLFDE